jgi:hypothetical protein
MKKIFAILLAVSLTLIIAGCEDDDNNVIYVTDTEPTAPQGVYSITGNQQIEVRWNGLYEQDVLEYVVFRSQDPIENYIPLGSIDAYPRPSDNIYSFTDNTPSNSSTYYYAVAARDSAGQYSELSWETVEDTPRPDGTVTLSNNAINYQTSAFNLQIPAIVADESDLSDFFIDSLNGVFYINVGNYDFIYGLIQDMGYTYSFDEINLAPEYGWSDLGFVELIPGHTYVIYTQYSNYAKVRVNSINANGSVTLRWAVQKAQDNIQLSLPENFDGTSRIPRPDKSTLDLNSKK